MTDAELMYARLRLGARFKWTTCFCQILDAMREARSEGRRFCPIFF